MNERIKKLYIQTANETADGKEWAIGGMNNAERFAQLIVRECANHCDLLLDHKISSEWSRGTHDCSRAIKKHFGVEE